MGKAQKKFYTVWKGHKTGVFDTWASCQQSIKGYSGAEYKSFATREAARKAYSRSYADFKGKTIPKTPLSKEQLKRIGKPNLNSVSVDAACNGSPGTAEYQCVETETKTQLFHHGPLHDSTNNVGEFLGLVHALAYMQKKGDTRPIYSDSKIAISWVKQKTHKSKLKRTERNAASFELMDRAIQWLKTNEIKNPIVKWETKAWGEIPADFGRK